MVVEALVGAVYIDCGLNDGPAREVMRRFGVYWPSSKEEYLLLKRHLKGLTSLGLVMT